MQVGVTAGSILRIESWAAHRRHCIWWPESRQQVQETGSLTTWARDAALQLLTAGGSRSDVGPCRGVFRTVGVGSLGQVRR